MKHKASSGAPWARIGSSTAGRLRSRQRSVLAITGIAVCAAIALYVGVGWWQERNRFLGQQIQQGSSSEVMPTATQPGFRRSQSIDPVRTLAQPKESVQGAPRWLPSRRIIANLEEQGVPEYLAEQLEVEQLSLPPDITNYLADSWNWLFELSEASSTLVLNGDDQPTMLQIHDISEQSILNEIGLMEADVLVLLDEQVLEFGRRDLFKHSRRMRAALESLERGEPVSVTILRDGRPLHLVYERW